MKILLVVQKPSLKRVIKDILDNHKDEFKDKYYFDFIPPVFHIDDEVLLFRKKGNEIYQMGEKGDYNALELKNLKIPANTFIEFTNPSFTYIYKENEFNQFDKIISICDPDDYGILGFAKYLEVNNIPYENAKYFYLNDFKEENVVKVLKSEAIEFDTIFKELSDKLHNNNFACQYPRKKLIINLRRESNLTRTDFCQYFNIPYRTVENWERGHSKCPEYLYDLIEYKLEKEGMFFRD